MYYTFYFTEINPNQSLQKYVIDINYSIPSLSANTKDHKSNLRDREPYRINF